MNGAATDRLLDERGFSKLRWRCRRGLLENDLFIERFFGRYQATLTEIQAQGLLALMDLPDNDLLDLLLRRTEPEGALAEPEVREVLGMLRTPVSAPAGADH
jgi:antitoxin CptB